MSNGDCARIFSKFWADSAIGGGIGAGDRSPWSLALPDIVGAVLDLAEAADTPNGAVMFPARPGFPPLP